MPYQPTGVQALFPVALPRQAGRETRREEYETQVAQNENNLNQNFSILYQKLIELEEILALISG